MITGPSYGDLAYRLAAPLWNVKIDYLSLTSGEFHVFPKDTTVPHLDVSAEADLAWGRILSGKVPSAPECVWKVVSGRSGYTRSAQMALGVRYFAGHASAPPLIELGGAACDYLRERNALLPLIERNIDGVTRIDLAGDITTGMRPAEFLAFGRSTRHASAGRAVSATGETEYIGSPTSDRRCRVYRYEPPHPRSDALRVEAVLRRELAKSAALALCSAPVDEIWMEALAPFSFKCPLWRQPSCSLSPRETVRNEPTAASRLRWLVKQIKPAVLEAHKAGLIDLQAWLDELTAG